MKTNELINAWQNSDQSFLTDEPKVKNELLLNIRGGASAGYVCSASAECSSTGQSCEPFMRVFKWILGYD